MINIESKALPPPTEALPQSDGIGKPAAAGPLRPPLRKPDPAPAVKPPERIAGIVPGVFGPALHRMMYRTLTGSPFACDFDLTFMFADPAVAKWIVKLIMTRFTPRRKAGRHADPGTIHAAAMYKQGLREYNALSDPPPWFRYLHELWQRIYQAVLPGYRAMDKYEHLALPTALRRNTRRYLTARGFKLTPGK